jgi:hypothetical protein
MIVATGAGWGRVQVVKGMGVFGPTMSGPLARWTPQGRRRMRSLLSEHLRALRADPDIPQDHLGNVENLLRRYAGDPDTLAGSTSSP